MWPSTSGDSLFHIVGIALPKSPPTNTIGLQVWWNNNNTIFEVRQCWKGYSYMHMYHIISRLSIIGLWFIWYGCLRQEGSKRMLMKFAVLSHIRDF